MIKVTIPQILLMVSAILLSVISLSAEVPEVISYQGRLTDSEGNPVADGDYGITFQIVEHDPVPMGESALWSSGEQTVTVTDGLFVYYLGSNVPLPAEIFNDDGLDSYFLRMKVSGSMLFSAGTELVTVPFSVRSIYSDTAAYALAGAGGGGANGWIDNGTVVRLETYTDFVGIGTNSPHAPLVVGKDLGSYLGQYVVSGSYYLDDVCGFKLGYNTDNHTTLEWNGDGADFAIHTKHLGVSYNNTLVINRRNVGILTTPRYDASLTVVDTFNLSTGEMEFGYGIRAEVHNTGVGNRLCAGYFKATGPHGVGILSYAGEEGGMYGTAGEFRSYNGNGIYATGTNYAANLIGDVNITGVLSKSSGSFKIDHPLDPENKYLQHSFVESPDMMNIYNGNVVLDDNGQARVELPGYFTALNRDFRYQLTAVGAPGPNLHIAEKISENQFVISGGEPGMEVSWQVTGIRQDPWANEHRIEVEVDKQEDERGYYIAPKLYGLGDERGLDYKKHGSRDIDY